MKADPDDFVRVITEDIRYLDDHVDNLIVVTSEYEADGSADAATRLYIDLLNRVNKTLSEDPCPHRSMCLSSFTSFI